MPMDRNTVFSPNLFQNKTALITGGGTGIGYAISQVLGSLGAHVILVSRTTDTLQKATTNLREQNMKANYLSANIRKEQEVKELFDVISSKYNGCDFLINNAGGQFAAEALKISANGFRAVVDLNLQGTWHMSTQFAQMLIDKGKEGRIINIVLCLKSGLPGMAHAGAARAGVVNLTKSLAYEWGEHGITVNAIAPGTIETSGLDQYDPEVIQQNMERLPVSRLGTPLEVAQAAAYLLSPAGSFITGTTLEIDGGEHLLGAINQL